MSLNISIKRRITQFLSLFILNSRFWNISLEKYCIPVLNCEACQWAWLGCPIGKMGDIIQFREVPWLILLMVFGSGLVLGRFLCGWVCPIGLVQDLLYKIPSFKTKVPKAFLSIKYFILLFLVILAAYYIGRIAPGGSGDDNKALLLFFCSICPAGTLQVAVPSMVSQHDYVIDFARMLRFSAFSIFLGMAIISTRSFCRIICPIGAMVAITNKFAFFRIRMDKDTCIKCNKCTKDCSMGIDVMVRGQDGKTISCDGECIECLKCQDVCPVSAINNNTRIIR